MRRDSLVADNMTDKQPATSFKRLAAAAALFSLAIVSGKLTFKETGRMKTFSSTALVPLCPAMFRRAALWCALLPVLQFSLAASSPAMEGFPTAARNYYPPHLIFLTPRPETPELPAQGSLAFNFGLNYSSVFVDETSDRWNALIDMEMAVVGIRIEYGVTEWLAISLEAPLVSMQDGFMDQYLTDYHQAFGFSNGGREDRPDDQFAYHLRDDGRDMFTSSKGGLELADTVLSAKIPLVSKKQTEFLSASLICAVKFPTGDNGEGLGSGHTDYGFFLSALAEKGKLALLFNTGWISLASPAWPSADIDIHDIWSAAAGARYALNDKWSLSALLNFYTSPFGGTGIKELDHDSYELTFGLTRRLSEKTALEIAFSEDIAGRGAPDFNLHVGISALFSGKP